MLVRTLKSFFPQLQIATRATQRLDQIPINRSTMGKEGEESTLDRLWVR